MKVSIPVEFEVEAVNNDEELDESTAKDAASTAAFDFLSFVEVSGYSTDTEEVTIWVDGFGECKVRLAEQN